MDKRLLKKLSFTILQIILLCIFLSGKTIKVPQNFSTIKQAVNMANDGDTIEVDDGFYLEKNIVIDKNIHLKSKNLFGAVVDGGMEFQSSIFLIRSEAEIEGFVLKNSSCGISQRHSPDVSWTAHDLAIIDMHNSAISINDVERNIGSATVFNIIVDNCGCAFSTNDAGRLKITNCLVTNSEYVFGGSNHLEFFADRISILNCGEINGTGGTIIVPKPPATNKINFGPDILILDSLITAKIDPNLKSVIENIFSKEKVAATEGSHQSIFESVALNILGNVYFRLGKYNKATELYHIASIVGERTGSLEIVWDSYYGLAKIFESQNKDHEALKYYKKSIEVIENLRNRLPLMEYKSAYMQSKMKVYESLVHLLYKLHKKYPSEAYHEEAFYFVENSKARALLDRFRESDIDLEACLDSEIKEELNNILNDMTRIQISLKQSHISQELRDSLLNELEEKDDSFTNLMVQIKSQNQEFANLISPHTCTYDEVRNRLLNHDSALIEYYIGEDNSFAFLATEKKLYMAHLQEPKILTRLVENYLYFLTLKGKQEFKGINGGKRLFASLIGPFKNMLDQGIKRIIIIPDNNLLYLPFETLVQTNQASSQKQEKPRFLIQDFDISYAPSSSVIMNLVERKTPELREMDLLAMASNYSEYGLPALSHSIREVKAISQYFKENKRILLIQNDATEKKFKSQNLSTFKIIHFATHAILDNEKWHRSALILKPEENSGEDSLLQPKDLFNLKFNSDLVVLSACQTRHGRLESGEGILGLTRVFLYSGAKSVLSSLWKIDDRFSPMFMKYFYKYLLEEEPKDAALRFAKLDMLNSRYCHPRFWAAFVLIGDFYPLSQNDTH